jgi:hypothetical protein
MVSGAFPLPTPAKEDFMSPLKTTVQFLGILVFSLVTTLASAQQRPGYGTAVDLATAKKIAGGALAEWVSAA